MNIENIGEELSLLVEKFEVTKSCLKLNELKDKLNSMLKERESLTFWNNLNYAMQTNKDIKALQELFETVQTLNIYIFNSSVRQVQRRIEYGQIMGGYYAGTIDPQKINLEKLDWLSSSK